MTLRLAILPAAALALAACLAAAPLAGAAGELRVRRNHYGDGGVRTEWHVRRGEDGEPVRHGLLRRFHPNGRLALRGYYRDGRPVGVWSWYDEQGRLLRRAVQQGLYEEVLAGRDLESPLTVYRGLRGTRLAEGLRKAGRPHGAWTFYHPGGAPRATGRFLRGLPDGRWKFLYRSGQVRRIDEYRLGVPHGLVLRAYRNGQERLQGRMEHGLRHGAWRTWHDNGQLRSEGRYVEDRREGEWRFWDARGRLTARVRYAGGDIVQRLPLPREEARPPPVIAHPRLLPFRPRIYDESGAEIRLRPE